MNERLMLKTRIEALRANLQKLQKFLEDVPDRKSKLDEVLSPLNEATSTSFYAADTELYNVFKRLQVDRAPADVVQKLGNAQKQLNAGLELISRAVEKVNEMHQHCFQIKTGGASWVFGNNLQRRTQPCLDALEAADVGLDKDKPNGKLWSRYREEASAPSQAIFAEYVDFLGGLALREAGFDTGISQVADELVSTYKPNRQLFRVHALPTRQQTVAKTLAQVIRVGFPEWTIWALPFTAHEFWHVTAQKDLEEELRAEIAKLLGPNPTELRFQTCLADAFATYTMGPAYAYPAFLLLLDPAQAFAEPPVDSVRVRAMLALLDKNGLLRLNATPPSIATETTPGVPANDTLFRPIMTMLEENGLLQPEATLGAPGDDTRACAILTMLNQMSSKSDKSGPPAYEQVRKDLKDMWDAAVSEVGAKMTPQTSTDNSAIKVMVEALWKILERSDCAPFLISSWETIQGWKSKLLDKNVDGIVPVELRQVLNAIWCARIDPERKLKIADIADLGWKLADKIPRAPTGLAGSRGRATAVTPLTSIRYRGGAF